MIKIKDKMFLRDAVTVYVLVNEIKLSLFANCDDDSSNSDTVICRVSWLSCHSEGVSTIKSNSISKHKS